MKYYVQVILEAWSERLQMDPSIEPNKGVNFENNGAQSNSNM